MNEPLTKREQFAMAAMQGVLAATDQDDCHPHCVASWVVELADALIAELERTAPTIKDSLTVPDANGWIAHKPGDPMPCDGDLLVDVKFKDGIRCAGGRASMWSFGSNDWWSNGRIIAWRPTRKS